MEISDNIKKYRKDKKMTQKQLAEKSGLSIASIQGYEQNKYKPKAEQLKKLAKALDVSVSDLSPNYIELLHGANSVSINGRMLSEAIDKGLPKGRKTSDILLDQLKQEIFLRSLLPEEEYNDMEQAMKSMPIVTRSYKTEALEIMSKLNKDGWEELIKYARYLTMNPKYLEPTEE